MELLDRIAGYARRCLSGEIPARTKHKWACQRLLDDIQHAEEKGFYWDEQEAQKIVNWFALLRHSKGDLAGQTIILTDWQCFFLCQIYGWRWKQDGKRRFTKSFLEVARKNAKTQMEAGVALYEISVTAAKNRETVETYSAGTKRDQSKLTLVEAKNLLKGSPLRPKFKITNAEIRHIKTGSFLRALSREDGQRGDGTNPALLILDEYHQHQTTEFYDLHMGANSKEPLLMIITTAGVDLNCPCYTEEYQYCSNLLNPSVDIQNESYWADIMEAEPGDDPGALDTWKAANPIRAFYPGGVEKIRQAYEVAKTIPEKMTAYLTKMLNIWVQQAENAYMDMAKFKAATVAVLPIDITGRPVYVGFDMSAKIDMTSVAFIFPYRVDGVTRYLVLSHSFLPNREKVAERKAVDKAPYDYWVRAGYITVTNSQIVDQQVVMDYVMDFVQKHRLQVQCLCFDPANAGKLMTDLDRETDYIIEEVFQSHKSLNESTCTFREQVYQGNVIIMVNPVLNFAMANAKIRTSQGLIKIDKDIARQRIDPVDATLCAFKLALYHEFEEDNAAQIDDWLGL